MHSIFGCRRGKWSASIISSLSIDTKMMKFQFSKKANVGIVSRHSLNDIAMISRLQFSAFANPKMWSLFGSGPVAYFRTPVFKNIVVHSNFKIRFDSVAFRFSLKAIRNSLWHGSTFVLRGDLWTGTFVSFRCEMLVCDCSCFSTFLRKLRGLGALWDPLIFP